MTGFLEWLLTNSIYGVAGFAILFGGLAYFLRKRFSRTPNHFVVGAVVFVVLIFMVPTYPRYQFHIKISDMLENAPHFRVLNKTYWGAIDEPLTWIFDFIGSIQIVGPENPTIGGFKRVILRYGEQTRVSLEEPDCAEKTISIAEPDIKGTFRYTDWNREMRDDENILYCETDWTKQHEALRKMLIEHFEKNKQNTK